jgi:NitT/TauT family transport system substrate-binding protein
MFWRAALTGFAILTATWAGSASAQSLEKTNITIASGGRALFAYLPMNIADTLGYFKAEGLSVDIPEFDGGSKVTQALVGGSADFANTVFDQAIRLQARGQDIKGVVAGTNYAYYVLLLPKSRAETYKSPADLKGLKIGVTSPGSGSHVLIDLVMAKAGLSSKNASIIQVGGGAGSIASMEKGDVDALSSLDPVISRLESTGRFVGVVDTRTAEGMKEVYGGDYLSACLLARADFIAKYPNTVQAVVNAQVRAIRWLAKAKPEEVMAALPDKWIGPDRDLFKASLAKALEGVSKDGLMSDQAVNNVYKSLVSFDENVAKAKDLSLAATRDNSFVTKALEKYR